jgi:RNA polymerase sigma-70 factor (ECF subfamily)
LIRAFDPSSPPDPPASPPLADADDTAPIPVVDLASPPATPQWAEPTGPPLADPPATAPSQPVRDARADADLLKASRTDPAAFRAFYDAWSEPVLSYFQRRVNDPQVALDLTAETFATVFEKRANFRWRGTSPGAWVFGIARHLLQRYFRTQAIQRRAIDRLGVQLPHYDDLALRRVEELVDNAEMRRLVQSALTTSKDADRQILELRFVQGLPYNEVAQVLGCSVNAARVRCHRALTRLEKQLADPPTGATS